MSLFDPLFPHWTFNKVKKMRKSYLEINISILTTTFSSRRLCYSKCFIVPEDISLKNHLTELELEHKHEA